MSQIMMLTAVLLNTILFSTMKHPMSMGITLLTQTTVICVLTASTSQNTWFSYILFLVFLGGMMVLFIYMTSVASNDLFTYSKKWMGFIPLAMITLLLITCIDPIMLNNNSEDTNPNPETAEHMTMSMFNYPNNILTIGMVLYLFLTLTVVVKITASHRGPLRSKN
uniref:NADH-ubiquinone oxidoreductase chain 6 n=1 Tax=Pseudolestes mirabilis TaxID=476809 RepID=D2DNI5_9ODON|nr:NADH dehydrogenase subunit 6 [Pseudolestes mirabilis]ACM63344.1 NADH dehydrogenase subunit 6 [Pseudolestes mirabilis]